MCGEASTCEIPKKSCPNNCTSPSTGVCEFSLISNGAIVDNCKSNDPLCSASCRCQNGYGGISCSLAPDEYAASVSIRNVLIDDLRTLTTKQDPSESVVTSWVATLKGLSQDPSLLSISSTDNLLDAVSVIGSSAVALVLPFNELKGLLNAVDSADISAVRTQDYVNADAVFQATLVRTNDILNDVSSLLHNDVIPGEAPQDFVYNTFRLTAVAQEINSFAEVTAVNASVPLTAFEKLSNMQSSSVSLSTAYLYPPDPNPNATNNACVLRTPPAEDNMIDNACQRIY